VIHPMRKWSPDPRFKARLIRGHKSTRGKPGLEPPVERPHLKFDRPTHFYFRDQHLGKLDATNVALASHVGNLEADVRTVLFVGTDFWVVPHVAQPLSVPQAMPVGPLHQPLNGAHSQAFAKWIQNTNVCDYSRQQMAKLNLEAVGVGARFELG